MRVQHILVDHGMDDDHRDVEAIIQDIHNEWNTEAQVVVESKDVCQADAGIVPTADILVPLDASISVKQQKVYPNSCAVQQFFSLGLIRY